MPLCRGESRTIRAAKLPIAHKIYPSNADVAVTFPLQSVTLLIYEDIRTDCSETGHSIA